MDAEHVKEFAQAIGSAGWRLDLHKFCEAIGIEPDTYGQELFVVFNQLTRCLARFDAETLSRIITAGKG